MRSLVRHIIAWLQECLPIWCVHYYCKPREKTYTLKDIYRWHWTAQKAAWEFAQELGKAVENGDHVWVERIR